MAELIRQRSQEERSRAASALQAAGLHEADGRQLNRDLSETLAQVATARDHQRRLDRSSSVDREWAELFGEHALLAEDDGATSAAESGQIGVGLHEQTAAAEDATDNIVIVSRWPRSPLSDSLSTARPEQPACRSRSVANPSAPLLVSALGLLPQRWAEGVLPLHPPSFACPQEQEFVLEESEDGATELHRQHSSERVQQYRQKLAEEADRRVLGPLIRSHGAFVTVAVSHPAAISGVLCRVFCAVGHRRKRREN